jgi:hypothetical protein
MNAQGSHVTGPQERDSDCGRNFCGTQAVDGVLLDDTTGFEFHFPDRGLTLAPHVSQQSPSALRVEFSFRLRAAGWGLISLEWPTKGRDESLGSTQH